MESEVKGRHLTGQLTAREHVEKIKGIIGKIGTVISHDGEDITVPVVTALTAANNAHLDGISLTQGVLDRHDAAVGRLSPSPSAQDQEQGEVANAYRGRDDDTIVVDVDELNEALHFAQYGVNETTAEKEAKARRI
jgi:hypothetical protein